MRLHVLGCSGGWPGANGATSGYLVEHEGQSILMDCGSGIMGRLMARWNPAELSGVLLSHLHFDHACDLTVLHYYLQKLGLRLPVYVPGEDQSPFRALLDGLSYDVQPYPDRLCLAGLEITSLPVRHPVPCRALRISDGEKTLVFTGDTNDCPGLAEFSAGADVMLADAAFLEQEWHEALPHMCAAGAARLAREAGAKKLYLTHFFQNHAPETMEKEACAIFDGAMCVHPGMVIDL